MPKLAIGLDGAEAPLTPAADAHDELADAVRQVELLVRILGGEALVIVVMAAQDDVRPGVVQILPEHTVRGEIATAARTPAGLVPQGQDASGGMGGQVRLEPLLLGAARGAADVGTLGVEGDNMPGAEVEGVVAFAVAGAVAVQGRGGAPKVAVVARRA